MTATTTDLVTTAVSARAMRQSEPQSRGKAVDAATRDAAAEVTFDIVRDRAGFDGLRADWDALYAASAGAHQIFQSFAWNWHWSRTFIAAGQESGPQCPIAVLVGRSGGKVVTIWPMTIERRAGLRELSWMGEPVSQYGDILVDATVGDVHRLLRDGWRYLIRELNPDVARLRKVRGDAAIAPLLAEMSTLHTSELEAPYIDLTRYTSFAHYEERFPNRAKRNRRRQMRRLQDAGDVGFQHLDAGPDARAFAAEGIEMKRRWLIDRGHVSPALADARMAKFMTAVSTAGDMPTATRVGVLTCGGQAAAIQIGFGAGRTRVLHVIAYDREFEKMAAGVLHLEEAIRHGFTEGLERIDLLAPKAEYKLDWADGTVAVVDHAIGLSTKGRVYARLYLGFARQHLKAGIERLPHGVRKALVTSHLRTTTRRLASFLAIG